ncbi:MAG: Gfo/Idh/MocA family oxidoreductase [Armatimonadetes bacterium]|nr:Gfo/Idh/MocA family oxidoreductase [Armatimonadota bacterium]
MDKVRVGVIGCGGIANAMHFPSLAAMPEVEIVGCCDVVPAKLSATADRFGIANRYTDYRLLLAEQSPEVVHVLLPPHHVFDVAIAVLDSGAHLMLEKPPGITAGQTAAMARAAEAAGRLSMVAFNRRHMPVLGACLAEVTARGPLDQFAVTFYKHHFTGDYFRGAIDVLTCDAIHAVDLMRHLGGEPRRVASSVRAAEGQPTPSRWNAFIEFENGAVGQLMTNWTVGKRFHHGELHARGVSCLLEFEREGTVWADNGEQPVARHSAEELTGSSEPYVKWGFLAENQYFVDCVRSGRQPSSHLGDAVKTMELAARILSGGWC